MIISWIVEFSKSVEVTKAQSLPLDKLTITQTYYSIHHGPLLIPVNSIARCLSLGKKYAKQCNVTSERSVYGI